ACRRHSFLAPRAHAGDWTRENDCSGCRLLLCHACRRGRGALTCGFFVTCVRRDGHCCGLRKVRGQRELVRYADENPPQRILARGRHFCCVKRSGTHHRRHDEEYALVRAHNHSLLPSPMDAYASIGALTSFTRIHPYGKPDGIKAISRPVKSAMTIRRSGSRRTCSVAIEIVRRCPFNVTTATSTPGSFVSMRRKWPTATPAMSTTGMLKNA